MTLRVSEDVWERFGEAARSAGKDRAALMREFVAWYLREPGAKLPRRP